MLTAAQVNGLSIRSEPLVAAKGTGKPMEVRLATRLARGFYLWSRLAGTNAPNVCLTLCRLMVLSKTRAVA